MNVFPTLPGLGINVKRSILTSTAVQPATSGKELRASWWSYPRYQYDLTFNFMRQAGFSAQTVFDEANTLANFFLSQGGQFSSFLFTDPIDNAVTAMGFGVGNAVTTAFQLQRCPVGQYQDALGTFQVSSTPRTNLCTYSQSFGSWTVSNATVTPNAAVAPDGSVTAGLLTDTTSATSHYTGGAASTAAAGNPYTISMWLQAGTINNGWLAFSGGVAKFANFSLTGAGSVISQGGSITNATITQDPNYPGWYRCTITAPAYGNDVVYAGVGAFSGYTGTGSGTLFFWGAQLESGSVATDYIPTVASTVTVTPSYWPATGSAFEPVYFPAPGLQVFRQDWQGNQLMYPTARTNQLKYSQLQSNAAYTPINVTVTGSIADPAGGTNAFTLTATAGGGNIYQNVTVSNVLFCDSLWARRRTGTGTVSLLQPNGTSLALALTSFWQRFW